MPNSRLPTMSRLPTRTEDIYHRSASRISDMGPVAEALENMPELIDVDLENGLPCNTMYDQSSYTGPRGPGGQLFCTCCRTLIEGPFTQVGQEVFHPHCFVCSSCRRQLEDRYLQSDDGHGFLCVYCRPRCAACKEPLGGFVPVYVDGTRYHESCFRCCDCSKQISKENHFRADRGYHCQLCHTKSLDEDDEGEHGASPDVLPGQPSWAAATGGPVSDILAMLQEEVEADKDKSKKKIERKGQSTPTLPKSPPAWLARLAAAPRMDKAFEKTKVLSDLVAEQSGAGKRYKESKSVLVKDAWGRDVIKPRPFPM